MTERKNTDTNSLRSRFGFSTENKKELRHQYSDSNIEFESEDKGVEILKELLNNEDKNRYGKPNKANINAQDAYNLTALHHAALRLIIVN